jgi:hypothetical protein
MQISALIERLQAEAAAEPSFFRVHLLREDIRRLEEAQALAARSASAEAFHEGFASLAWAPSPERALEFAPEIARVAQCLYPDGSSGSAALNDETWWAWVTLQNRRLERLLGCLSSPVPKLDASEL